MSSRIHVHPTAFGAPHVKKMERDALERDYQAFLAKGKKPEIIKRGVSGIKDKSYAEHTKQQVRAAKAKKTPPVIPKD